MSSDADGMTVPASAAQAADILVTTAADIVADDGETSLREAVALANANPGGDRIAFDPTVFDGEPQDIVRLTLGQIEITERVFEKGIRGLTRV